MVETWVLLYFEGKGVIVGSWVWIVVALVGIAVGLA